MEEILNMGESSEFV